MKVLIDQDEVSIFRTKMLLYVNKIEEEIERIQLLKNDLIWQGQSFDKYMDLYDRTILDIKSRIEELTRYIDFLNNFNKIILLLK